MPPLCRDTQKRWKHQVPAEKEEKLLLCSADKLFCLSFCTSGSVLVTQAPEVEHKLMTGLNVACREKSTENDLPASSKQLVDPLKPERPEESPQIKFKSLHGICGEPWQAKTWPKPMLSNLDSIIHLAEIITAFELSQESHFSGAAACHFCRQSDSLVESVQRQQTMD